MKRPISILQILSVISAVLLSIPWLVPHTGALILVGFVPLLIAEALARQYGLRRFWLYPLLTFLLWNTATTFWVCNATVGGGIFAIVANSLQMLLVWALYRLSCKIFKGGYLPYIVLAMLWTAWERLYFNAQISWPWLVLGNAFARSTQLIQWYEYTGVLGGSVWTWAVNLGIFGLIVTFTDGRWRGWTLPARLCAVLSVPVLIVAPLVWSKYIYGHYEEKSEGTVEVLIVQPNFDPYEKFGYLTQAEQTQIMLDMCRERLDADSVYRERPLLVLAPETFTSDVSLNDMSASPTVRSIATFLQEYPGSEMLYGASTHKLYNQKSPPSPLARQLNNDKWYTSHNTAILEKADTSCQIFHKSKLVVGVEMTPYPGIFVTIDDWLSGIMRTSGLMGRCEGQDEVSLLHFGEESIPLGCAVCYESVYGDYCTAYVRKGARAMTVITNDAWWGNTPGYKQHLSYSCLRAIELRRDIARCGNTGISCFIDQRGDILEQGEWWTRETLTGAINLNSEQTFFAIYGDITGRVCSFAAVLLLLLMLVRGITGKK